MVWETQGAHKSVVSVESTVCKFAVLTTPIEKIKANLNRRMTDTSLLNLSAQEFYI